MRILCHHHSQDILRFREASLLDKASTGFCSFMFPWPLAWFLDGTSPPISTPKLPRASCPSALLGWVPYYYSTPRHKSSAPRFHNLVKHFLDSFLKKKKQLCLLLFLYGLSHSYPQTGQILDWLTPGIAWLGSVKLLSPPVQFLARRPLKAQESATPASNGIQSSCWFCTRC